MCNSDQRPSERADLRSTIPLTGSTLNWRTEHDSKYTPIVFTQDLRYQIIVFIFNLFYIQ